MQNSVLHTVTNVDKDTKMFSVKASCKVLYKIHTNMQTYETVDSVKETGRSGYKFTVELLNSRQP